ncbi:MAG: hypothetical protein ACJ8FO_10005 [Sphingomicrobium sp.]
MATEAKPFASLSSGLLARKGAARPAMRPQGFGQVGNGLEDLGWNDMGFEPPKPADAARDEEHDAFGEEVVEHPRAHHPTGLTPIQSPVHDQQAEIAERFNGADDSGEAEIDEIDEIDETAELYEPEAEDRPDPEQAAVAPIAVEPIVSAPARSPALRHAPRARAVLGTKGKAAFTLRLDPDRHLKLRLACAVDGRSAQQLVTDALDHLLERMPDLDGLADKAKRRG